MNYQFISPGIGGSLLWFFSFTDFAFGGIFVVLCLQNEEKRRDLLSLAVLEIELAMVGLVFYGQAFCP